MARRNTMQAFIAQDGYVYDYAVPRMAKIIDQEGNEHEEEEHLYAKRLFLGTFDDIKNYKLVKDPKGV